MRNEQTTRILSPVKLYGPLGMYVQHANPVRML